MTANLVANYLYGVFRKLLLGYPVVRISVAQINSLIQTRVKLIRVKVPVKIEYDPNIEEIIKISQIKALGLW